MCTQLRVVFYVCCGVLTQPQRTGKVFSLGIIMQLLPMDCRGI